MKKKVLFVGYGGGHIRMLIPVARLLQERGLAEPVFLGLTTARAEVERAGFACLGFADFVDDAAADAQALARGRELAARLDAHAVSFEDSAAYLGLSYADLQARHGAAEAARLYAEQGRQCFLPVPTLQRVLRRVAPAAVVTTSAPRAERAAVLAARETGIPALCLVDLFAAYEIDWLRAPDYADRVCVLNEAVRQRLLAAGRDGAAVVVTGNPAFDTLLDPAVQTCGAALRTQRGWGDGSVWLWASQVEPASHPCNPGQGDPQLPYKVMQALQAHTAQRARMHLVIRPHPSEGAVSPALGARQWLSPASENLHALLWACDGVVVLTSTVGLEARLAGCRVVQALGSLYSADMPYRDYGVADEAVHLPDLPAAIDRQSAQPRHAAGGADRAAPRVLAQLEALL